MKLRKKFWRGLLISLTLVLIGLAGLTPSSVGAQDNKVPAAPTLNMDQTQRVGTDTMGYVTIPADLGQCRWQHYGHLAFPGSSSASGRCP